MGTDQIHETLSGPLAGGEPKPRRQLDRNYSQLGKFRGVRFREKGRYSAELKVKEARC